MDDVIWRINSSPSGSDPRNLWMSSLLGRLPGVSPEACRALEVDTRHIVKCFTDRMPSSGGRPISGLVLGAVQSGKTGSMLAVSALALDKGFNIIVVVSGTRVSLWQQTLYRASRDLDGFKDDDDLARRRFRVWLPDPSSFQSGRLSPSSLFAVSQGRLKKYLQESHPVVAIVMKQADHLNALRESLHRAIVAADRPLKMLVVDDESDDGSILSTPTQGGIGDKFLPKWIEGLWSVGPNRSEVFHNKLEVVYLAYTATPQANLLQHDHNPLSPRDFVTCIRAPGTEGSVELRERPTFHVPSVTQRHIGGAEFYPQAADQFQPCTSLDSADGMTRHDWEIRRMEYVGDAMRAFLVATACRLIHSKRTYAAAEGLIAATREEVLEVMPPIASMLFNPASSVESQFEGELTIRAWVHSESPHFTVTREEAIGNERPRVDWALIASKIELERDKWAEWLRTYRRAAELLRLRPGCAAVEIPPEDWAQVERVLVADVLPAIRVQVVNSAGGGDAPPNFSPTLREDGSWGMAESLCTIFVAGNIMSRGLTLEGLTTTLFLRDPGMPLADTQMQMQRWFGYRGPWLQYCRVFAFEDQINRFRQYHLADEALRTEILELECEPGGAGAAGISPQVLGGRAFMPTGKVENLRRLPLAPGAAPFVTGMWDSPGDDPNLSILEHLFIPGSAESVHVDDVPRGLLLKRKLGLVEAADLLDQFRYKAHDPSPTGEQHLRWASLERTLGLNVPREHLFRPGMSTDRRCGESVDRFIPPRCPYSIAAYLRLWAICMEHSAVGLYPNDNPSSPWGGLSVAERRRRCPNFSVGIRFGGGPVVLGTVIDHVGEELGNNWRVRLMERDIDVERSQLVATWGSRNPSEDRGYQGDQYFDYHRAGETRKPRRDEIDGSQWRGIGEDGLVLFHVVSGACGKPRLAVGICLTGGGPDPIAILRPIP